MCPCYQDLCYQGPKFSRCSILLVSYVSKPSMFPGSWGSYVFRMLYFQSPQFSGSNITNDLYSQGPLYRGSIVHRVLYF